MTRYPYDKYAGANQYSYEILRNAKLENEDMEIRILECARVKPSVCLQLAYKGKAVKETNEYVEPEKVY